MSGILAPGVVDRLVPAVTGWQADKDPIFVRADKDAWATAAVKIDLIVACRTLAGLCRTTWPLRWIRPRMGGLPFVSVPRPAEPASLRHSPSCLSLQQPPASPCARLRRRPR